jgi:hypothetical protein
MKRFVKKLKPLQFAMLLLIAVLFAFGVVASTDESFASIGYALPFLAFFGVVPGAPGTPDQSTLTGSGEIPILFSNKVIEEFYDVSVAPFTANSDYDGEIKQKGDTVVINSLPDILIQDYTPNGTINWQLLAMGRVDLKVDRSSYFAIRLDKITQAQLAQKNTLDRYSKHGAERMREHIDEKYLADVYLSAHAENKGLTAGRKSAGYNLGVTGTPIQMNKANATDMIARAAAVATEQNWPKQGRWMIIPTWMKYLLDTSELKEVSVTGAATSFMTNGGYFKRLYDFDLFETNLYTPVETDCYNITFGHKVGVTFAVQLTDMEWHDKFENTIGKGMKGFQVYDWKVIKSEAVGVLYARKA